MPSPLNIWTIADCPERGLPSRGRVRGNILVDRELIAAIKAVANMVPAHDAQVPTYLRMSGLRLGLLINFHARLPKDGMRRFVV